MHSAPDRMTSAAGLVHRVTGRVTESTGELSLLTGLLRVDEEPVIRRGEVRQEDADIAGQGGEPVSGRGHGECVCPRSHHRDRHVPPVAGARMTRDDNKM